MNDFQIIFISISRSETTALRAVDFQYCIFHNGSVKLTAKVKLLSDASDARVLLQTMRMANRCANWISARAWESQTFGTYNLHALTYHKAREKFDLSAQVVVRLVAKVADAYKLDKTKRRRFRALGAMPYDDRILSWRIEACSVSIWTVEGRKRIEWEAGPRQAELLKSGQGESDLIHHRGRFYLAATCDVPDPDPTDIDDFLGIDMGVAQIASDSDGQHYSGSTIKSVRYRHRRLRAKLQRIGTRSAKRRLKKLAGKEKRFVRDTNHSIAKQIVAVARRTKRGIAVENLTGIRSRVRARRKQRAVLHSWAFAQLRDFLTYKAALAGVRLVTVDPRNSSRECSQCGHVSKSNRSSQSRFSCRQCGFTCHADQNAAVNLRERGRAAVNPPNVARVASGDFQSQLQATGFQPVGR